MYVADADELFFVVKTLASYTTPMPLDVPKKGLKATVARFFGRNPMERRSRVLTWHDESFNGNLDHSAVTRILQGVEASKEKALAHVLRERTPAPDPDFTGVDELEVSLWVGRPWQFRKIQFEPGKYWADKDTGATLLKDGQITAENIKAFVARFDTEDARAEIRRKKDALEARIEASVAPVTKVKHMQRLKIKTGGPP